MVPVLEYPEDLAEHIRRTLGDGFLRAFLEAVARPPRRYYLRVNTLKAGREELLARLRARGLDPKADEVLPDAVYLRAEGPFEIPKAERRVVADKYAAESVYMGAHLYGPGVLEADPDIMPGDEVVVLDPRGEPVGWGIARMDSAAMNRREPGLAVEVLVSGYRIPSLRGLPEFDEGLFYEQSLPAILTCHVLDPQPGETIVDMCAAPGGKTTHAAQLMRNEGKIYAFEKSPRRAERLRANLRRLGVEIAEVIVHDARYVHVDFPGLKADRVILDPPCSALGVRPKRYETKSAREVLATAEYQRQLMKAAAKILKPGGRLVYSTCTVTLEENEHVIRFAVERLGLRLVEQRIIIGSQGISIEGADLVQRFHPHVHDTTGYFIALLEKP